jgi:alpha-N-arabinofuranosidase
VVTTNAVEDKNSTPDSIAEAAFALPVELGRRLRGLQGQINQSENFRDKTHIAFTEWLFACCEGVPKKDAPRYDNMGGALAVGGFFNMLLQNADIVPISDMTGIIEFTGIWKKRGRVFATPAYYVFQLYSTAGADVRVAVDSDSPHYDVHHGVTRLPEILNVPYLDLVAVLNKAGGRLTIFGVNRHVTEDLPTRISIGGFAPQASGAVESIYASSIYEGNDEMRPDFIKPVQSTVVVKGAQVEYTFRHESVTRIELVRQ